MNALMSKLYIASSPSQLTLQADNGNNLLRRVNLTNGLVTTIAGNTSGTVGSDNYGRKDGVGTAASFYQPFGIALDVAGTFMVVVRSCFFLSLCVRGRVWNWQGGLTYCE